MTRKANRLVSYIKPNGRKKHTRDGMSMLGQQQVFQACSFTKPEFLIIHKGDLGNNIVSSDLQAY